jgi:signal recognition particle subunit SRP54
MNLQKKLKENSFNLEDYLEQLESVGKMGNLGDMMNMIPGLAGKMKGGMPEINEKQLLRTKAIIQSMTPDERKNPKILNYSRRKRIAAGCGLQVQDVNRLIKQYEQTCDMMKKMTKARRLPF